MDVYSNFTDLQSPYSLRMSNLHSVLISDLQPPGLHVVVVGQTRRTLTDGQLVQFQSSMQGTNSIEASSIVLD